MTNDEYEYMAFLYDRAAQRLGYESYADQSAALDAAMSERRAKEESARKADLEAWARAQLSTD
jgi:hypothetical protein